MMAIPLAGDANTSADKNQRSERFPLRGRELLLIAAFWTLVASLTEVNRAGSPSGPAADSTLLSIPTTLVLIKSFVWALMTPALFLLAGYAVGHRADLATRVALLASSGILGALAVNFTTNASLAALSSAPIGGEGGRMWRVGGFGLLNDLIIATGVLAAGLARAYSLRYHARQEQASLLQAQLAEARLDALRRQLDPHFLFNTLHAISSLVERDPRGVRRMISRLSELLRHSFEGGAESEVSLREELAFLALYLEIMQVRFQGRLHVETVVADELLDARVPNLILQPLVENAIRHGVEKITGPGEISVEASLDEGQLVLRVQDNGPGPEPAAELSRSGVGLRNTMARLDQLYGGAQRFALTRDESGRTVAEVRLPYRVPVELRAAGVAVSDGEAAHVR